MFTMIIEAVLCMPGWSFGRDALGVTYCEVRLALIRIVFLPGSAVAHLRRMDRALRHARSRLELPARGV